MLSIACRVLFRLFILCLITHVCSFLKELSYVIGLLL